MRRGPNGGLLVCEPDAAPATHAIIIYLEYLGTTIGDLLGCAAVAGAVGGIACRRADR